MYDTLQNAPQSLESDFDELDKNPMSSQEMINKEIMREVAHALLYWVEKEEVEEVFMNRPKEIWLKLNKPNAEGRYWERRMEKSLDSDRIRDMIDILSNYNRTEGFGPIGNPVTYGTMPGGHRIVAGYGPHFQYNDLELSTEGTCVISCRKQTASKLRDYTDYGLKRGNRLDTYRPQTDRRADGVDPIIKLINIIKRGESLIISGETGTGKTTLINRILRELDPQTRIITVQDTLELKIPQLNRFTIYMPREGNLSEKFSYRSVIDLITRSNSDTNIYGEISASNAESMLEAEKSGNSNFITSIHSPTAEEVPAVVADRIAHSRPNLSEEGRQQIMKSVRERFRIVQIVRDKNTNERKIVQII